MEQPLPVQPNDRPDVQLSVAGSSGILDVSLRLPQSAREWRATLIKYGRHTAWCGANQYDLQRYCNCGWWDIVTALAIAKDGG
jgi:hypothetical protein